MRLRRATASARPTRRAANSSRPPANLTPGTSGLLHLRLNDEPLEHQGEFRYVGQVLGLYAFVPASTRPVVYLHPDEVVGFEERR